MTTPFRGKLRIRHLEIVLAVADFGSLSKAAGKLQLTQSGLSRAITEVEEISGGRLFERTGKGMLCTPLGSALCRHAQVLLGDLDKAETDLEATVNGSLGSLTVGCFTLFSGWPLADAVCAFQSLHPRVALSIQTGMHDRLIEDLDGGRIDLVVSRRPPTLNPEIYRFTDLMGDSVALVCGTSHPLAKQAKIALAQCIAFPWISPPPKNRVRMELEARLRECDTPFPVFIGALSLEFSLRMIESGPYLWLLPCSVASRLANRGVMHILPVELDLSTPPLAAIWLRERLNTKQAREFISALAGVTAVPGAAEGTQHRYATRARP